MQLNTARFLLVSSTCSEIFAQNQGSQKFQENQLATGKTNIADFGQNAKCPELATLINSK